MIKGSEAAENMKMEADSQKKEKKKRLWDSRFGQLDLSSLLSMFSKWIKGFMVLTAHVL